MPPPVLAAFQEAASASVSIEQLQAAACRKIAELTGTEAGLVTTGAAGSLTLGTAAILAGHDLSRMERLPHSDGFPHEMIIAREQRSGYDHAVRLAGARLVEVGFNEIVANAGVRRTETWEYEAAISDKTAGIVYAYSNESQPPLSEVVAIAHKHSLPVLVDAAGELPPRSNLKVIPASGADLVAFSGGKAIRGPQSTGILCGRRALISSAALQLLDMDDHFALWDPPSELIDRSLLAGHPRHGMGRSLKVSKEEIAALLVALDLFASGAYDEEWPAHQARLETIANGLTDTPVQCQILHSPNPEKWPRLQIKLPDSNSQLAFGICRSLRNGSPPIYLGHARLREGILEVNPLCLDDNQAATIAQRLREELKSIQP